MRFGHGLSGNLDTEVAARQVCERAEEALVDPGGGKGAVDIAFLFFTVHHATEADKLARVVRERLAPRALIGVTTSAVVGGQTELEGSPGVSLLAGRVPGVEITTFDQRSMLPIDATPDGAERMADVIGAGDKARATFVLADAFSVPLVTLVPLFNGVRQEYGGGHLIGGVASGATEAKGHALILDGTVRDEGLVGVTLSGPLQIDTIVSQGCRPVGPNYVITKARKNIIEELGGRPALTVVQETLSRIDEDEQELLRAGGPLIGRVINEYKERFGRDDYLIRAVVGADERSGAVAIGDFVKAGQTVRLHLRDAQTASEDLAMLLDAQKLREPPAGALLVTCTARGRAMFEENDHDAKAICRAFQQASGGEQLARAGEPIEAKTGPVPLAGFFANGEFGPVGGECFQHGHTACVTMFREP